MSYFQILHGIDNIAPGEFKVPSSGMTSLAKGYYVWESSDGSGEITSTGSGNGLGFVIQEVVSSIDYEDKLYLPGVSAEKVTPGDCIAIRDGEGEFCAEDLFITTGDRAITNASTTVGSSELTVVDGKWGKAITGDYIMGYLMETDYRGNTGRYRIRRVLGGPVKA